MASSSSETSRGSGQNTHSLMLIAGGCNLLSGSVGAWRRRRSGVEDTLADRQGCDAQDHKRGGKHAPPQAALRQQASPMRVPTRMLISRAGATWLTGANESAMSTST